MTDLSFKFKETLQGLPAISIQTRVPNPDTGKDGLYGIQYVVGQDESDSLQYILGRCTLALLNHIRARDITVGAFLNHLNLSYEDVETQVNFQKSIDAYAGTAY